MKKINGTLDLIRITIQIQLKFDNNNMNKLKLTNYSMTGIPQNAILSYANGDVVVLDKITTTRYYDKMGKTYHSYPKFYKINNHYYA